MKLPPDETTNLKNISGVWSNPKLKTRIKRYLMMKSFRDERRDKLCLDVFFRPINISKSALLHSGTWCQIWDKSF